MKVLTISLLVVALCSPYSLFADTTESAVVEASEADAAAESGSETTGAMIDTAEDTGKDMAGSAINQAAGSIGGDSALAGTAKSLAGEKANEGIGKVADEARAKYGIEKKNEVPAEAEEAVEDATEE